MLQSRKTAERLQRVLPQARVCVYRDAGHALIGVGQEILAFLPTDYFALGINRR